MSELEKKCDFDGAKRRGEGGGGGGKEWSIQHTADNNQNFVNNVRLKPAVAVNRLTSGIPCIHAVRNFSVQNLLILSPSRKMSSFRDGSLLELFCSTS